MMAHDRLYTEAQDTLDPDDQIFPRAVTRVGIRYQASVLSWEEQQAAEARHGFGETEAGPSRHLVGKPMSLGPEPRTHCSRAWTRHWRAETRVYNRHLVDPE